MKNNYIYFFSMSLFANEIEKNKIDKIVIETELDNAKRIFADEILNGLGKSINTNNIYNKPIKIKRSFFYKIKNFFKNL